MTDMPKPIDRASPQSAPVAPKPSQPPAAVDLNGPDIGGTGMPRSTGGATFGGPPGRVVPEALNPSGAQVNKSAHPGALWPKPAPEKPIEPSATEFARLSPAEQQAQLTKLRAEREQLSIAISTRLAELDAGFRKLSPEQQLNAVRYYRENSQNLTPEVRQALDPLIAQANSLQGQIRSLRGRGDEIKSARAHRRREGTGAREYTDAERAERRALAKELLAKRAEAKKVAAAAVSVVDKGGLKADLLAHVETVIDPKAAAAGSGQSLFDLLKRFFKLDHFITHVAPKIIAKAFDKMHANAEQSYQDRQQRFETTRKEHAELEQRVATIRVQFKELAEKVQRESEAAEKLKSQ
jgi:hypothetical protein